MDPFKEKLYEEFEANSQKLLGVPDNRVREVLSDKGEDIDAEFEAAWDFGGAAFMRQCMRPPIPETLLEKAKNDTER
ncbi:hypothetical protein N9E28_02735 [Alphaproteobacteria bacterium]|nr:hypothetical protein [Alphaproteobacteria bacterium]NCG09534.1 hypothetical protein [Alphaproteobacteria bacterium]